MKNLKLKTKLKYFHFRLEQRLKHRGLSLPKLNSKKFKRFSLFLVLFILLQISLFIIFKPGSVSASWFDDSWAYRKKLVVDHTKVSGSADLTDFPALISRTDTDLRDKAQADGDDIIFTDVNGQMLAHEIQLYTTSTGVLIAWVKVPKLYTANTTVLYMYYGNPSATNMQNSSAVWDSNHTGVWHLDEASGSRSDSKNTNTLTDDNTVASKTGKIGSAADFENEPTDNNERLYITDANQNGLNLNTGGTIEAWISIETLDTTMAFLSKENGSPNLGYYLRFNAGNNAINFLVSPDGSTTSTQVSTLGIDYEADTWYHIVATYDGSYIRLYHNGTQSNQISYTDDINSSNAHFSIGGRGSTTSLEYDGAVDEVKISNIARSADWIATTYSNQNDPSAFFSTVGSEEKGDSPSLALKFDEGYGTIANDSTANNNDGTISGASWNSSDICLNDNCLFFDGTDDVVTVTNANSIDMDQELASALTYQAWVRVNSDGESNVGQIMNKGTNTYLRTTNEGADGYVDLEASLDLATTDATLTITNGIKLNHWHHIAMSYTDDADDEISIYINGVLRGSSSNGVGAPASDANNLLLGGPSTANYHGFIEEFKLFNKELSASQIKTNYIIGAGNSGSSAVLGKKDKSFLSDGLVGYWKMDESTGNPLDFSGNALTLTNNNSTGFGNGKFGNAGLFVAASNNYFSTTTAINSVQTVTFWVNPSSTSDEFINLSASAYLTAGSGTITATGLTLPTVYVNGVANGTITANVWNHVAVTTLTPITANAIEIGRANSAYHNGSIDEIRLYSRHLSNSEIQQLYTYTAGPILHWKFDDNTGVIANDSSGNGNYGDLGSPFHTAAYLPTWTNGKYGSALKFDGETSGEDLITAATNTIIDGRSTFSFSTWVKYDYLDDWQMIVAKYGNSTHYYSLGLSGNEGTGNDDFSFCISNHASNDSCGSTSSNIVQVNTWYHLVAIFDGTQTGDANRAKLFVNGIPQTLTFSAEIPATTTATYSQPLYIGSFGAYGTIGIIDDFKIYNYAINSGQIVKDLNAGHPAPGSPIGSPLAWWKFDDAYTDTPNNSGQDDTQWNLKGTCPGASTCPTLTNNGKVGKALDFDGTDDAGFISETATEYNILGDLTISTWINADTIQDAEYIIHKGETGSESEADNDLYFLRFDTTSGNDIEYGHESGAGVDNFVIFDTNLSVDTWYHLVLTRNIDTKTVKLYVNGILRGTSTYTANPTGGTGADMGLGADDNNTGGYFDGTIDELKIYTMELTADQVKLEYNQASAVVWGAKSTTSSGAIDNSAMGEYCLPGDSTTCNSPVGHWKLDENTGQYAYDTSTGIYHGTLGSGSSADTADPLWIAGKYGTALKFDGSNDYVNVTDNAALNFSGGSFTAEVWFQLDILPSVAGRNYKVLNKMADSGTSTARGWDIMIHSSDNKLRTRITNSSGTYFFAFSNAALTTDTWYHAVLNYNGSTDTLSQYVNGKKQTSTATVVATDAAVDLTFGAYISGGTSQFDGIIDDIKIYNYERSAAQIAWDYNRGGPTGWWKFDECQGTTAYDASGNGYNGTITIGGTGTYTTAGSCNSGITTESWNAGTNGKNNSAIALDGTNDHVALPAASNLARNVSSFTMSTWFNPAAINRNHQLIQIGVNTAGTDSRLLLEVNSSNNIRAGGRAPDSQSAQAVVTTTSLPSADIWYFITATIDIPSDTVKIYLNGIEQPTTGTISFTNNSTDDTTSANSSLGSEDNGSTTWTLGKIDEVKLFNYALTPNQIKTLYGDGAVKFAPITGSP